MESNFGVKGVNKVGQSSLRDMEGIFLCLYPLFADVIFLTFHLLYRKKINSTTILTKRTWLNPMQHGEEVFDEDEGDSEEEEVAYASVNNDYHVFSIFKKEDLKDIQE